MPGLPATGTLSYDGIAFTGAHHITAQVEPQVDDSGRTVIAHRITIRVNTILAEDNSLDGTLERLRFRLQQSGRRLIFRNKGFGDDLNPAVDIAHGPDPRILSWEPVGDDRAAQVIWEVTTTVAPCKPARSAGIVAINWGATWSINRHGDTTRTLIGHILIAAGQVGQDSADRYRQFFAPRALRGFTREQTWNLSLDKRRIDFTIVDEQIPSPNPYPPNITAIEGSHSVSWRRGRDAHQSMHTITATITPEAGLTGSHAWGIFVTIALHRLRRAQQAGLSPFLLGLDIDEDLFGRPQRFRLNYKLLGHSQDILSRLVRDVGLWTPFGLSWDVWIDSVSDSVFDQRGHAQLRDVPGDDRETTLCNTATPITPNNLQQLRGISPGDVPFRNATPDPDKSWLYSDTAIIPLRKRPVTQQSYLQSPDDPKIGSYDSEGNAYSGSVDFGPDLGTAETLQVGGRAVHAARFLGHAQRAGHEIPEPRLETIGTQKPEEINNVFMQREVGNFFGVPVYEARWAIDYMLPGSPGRIRVPRRQDRPPRGGIDGRGFRVHIRTFGSLVAFEYLVRF